MLTQLDLRQITKRYPGCLANDHIDLAMMPGEVLGLAGVAGNGQKEVLAALGGHAHGFGFWDLDPFSFVQPGGNSALCCYNCHTCSDLP